MRLLVQSATIFRGTSMAAGLLALGGPRDALPAAAPGHHEPLLASGASSTEPGPASPPRR